MRGETRLQRCYGDRGDYLKIIIGRLLRGPVRLLVNGVMVEGYASRHSADYTQIKFRNPGGFRPGEAVQYEIIEGEAGERGELICQMCGSKASSLVRLNHSWLCWGCYEFLMR